MGFQDTIKKKPKLVPVLLLVVSVLVLAGFVWKVYLPKSTAAKALSEEISSIKEEVEQANTKARKLNEVKKATAKLEEELAKAKEKLPSEEETDNLKRDLESMMKKAGLDVTDIKEGKAESPAGDLYKQFSFSFKTNGTYHEMGRFMESLDSEERLLRVSNLQMSNGKVKGSEVIIPSEFDIIAYSAAKEKKQ